MRERVKRGKGFLMNWLMCAVFGLICWMSSALGVWAQGNSFVIEAQKLSTNEETYSVQLNIENQGADWEGVVRLFIDEDYKMPTAYDTVLTLPQGSTKQFVVKVPRNSIEDTNGTIKVILLDKKEQKTAEKEFKRFLKEEDDVLTMGILSDDYASLTYLDMGGQEMYFYGDDYPIKLTEITQNHLADSLDALEFLVIDTFNTGVLTDEEKQAIEKWNGNGGILIVGTGAYAADTLAGFQNSYLGMDYTQIYEPGTFYSSTEYVDMSLLTIAELDDLYQAYYAQYMNSAMITPYMNGAIGVLPFSLTELAAVGSDFYVSIDQQGFVWEILDFISSESSNRRHSSTYNNNYYNYNMLRRVLHIIGSVNSPLNFGVLRAIIIIYVIFAGPVLYLILRASKKRELYWVTVPVTALIGILIVFLAGRGFEVVDTRVYSVTVENLSGNQKSESYMYCYDASHKEWSLKLQDGFEYAGALMNEEYGYGDDDKYYHHVVKEGDVMSVGIRPSSNFEDSYFMAAGKGTTEGSLELQNVEVDNYQLKGTVVNHTDKDFEFYAVIAEGQMCVFENLEAGESEGLGNKWAIYNSDPSRDAWSDYLYNFLDDIRRDSKPEQASSLAALGVAMNAVFADGDMDKTAVIGVYSDDSKVFDDDCSEMSFRCLYAVE